MTGKSVSVSSTFILISLLLSNCATGKSQRSIAQQNGPAPSDCAPKTEAIYPTVNMRQSQVLNDQIRGRVPDYFTDAQREANRFVVFNGMVYKSDCTLMGQPDGFSPSDPTQVQQVNYVMDAAGNFYWVDEFKNVMTRHSAVFDARPVSGAGNITIAQSRITQIDSDSGHYPTGPVFDNVLKQLQLDGVDLTQVSVIHNLNNTP
jgi:hypothetical protein